MPLSATIYTLSCPSPYGTVRTVYNEGNQLFIFFARFFPQFIYYLYNIKDCKVKKKTVKYGL